MAQQAPIVTDEELFNLSKFSRGFKFVEAPGSTSVVAKADFIPWIVGSGGSHILIPCLQRNFKKEMLVRIRIKSEDYNPEDAVILERAAKVGIEARRRNLPHLLQTFGYASSMASRFQTFELVEKLTPITLVTSEPVISTKLKTLSQQSINERDDIIVSFIKSIMTALDELQQVKHLFDPLQNGQEYELAFVDLKPENLLLDELLKSIRICDYGSVRVVPADKRACVQVPAIATTKAFAPTEVNIGVLSSVTDIYMAAKTAIRMFGTVGLTELPKMLSLPADSKAVRILTHMLQVTQTDRPTRAQVLEWCGDVDTDLAARYLCHLYSEFGIHPPEQTDSFDRQSVTMGPPMNVQPTWMLPNFDIQGTLIDATATSGDLRNTTTGLVQAFGQIPGGESVDEQLVQQILAANYERRVELSEAYLKGITGDEAKFKRASGFFLITMLQRILVKPTNHSDKSVDAEELSKRFNDRKREVAGVNLAGKAKIKFMEKNIIEILFGNKDTEIARLGNLAFRVIRDGVRLGVHADKNLVRLSLNPRYSTYVNLMLACGLLRMHKEEAASQAVKSGSVMVID